MFRNIFTAALAAVLLSYAPAATACDACGCGVGSYQFGILPQLQKNFAGVRYQFKTDRSSPYHDLQTEETFRTAEIWGRFYPVKRVQVFGILPYQINTQTTGEVAKTIQGFGDILVLANYNLINNTDSLYQPIKHNLLVGGGVKLPTGNAQKTAENNLINPNLQLGSGSVDFVANAIYTIRYNSFGLNTDVTYKANTANKNSFRFGNKLGASSRLFSVLKIKEAALMPNAGFSSEITAKDNHYGSEINESGGYANFVNLGTEGYFKNFSAGVSFQKPVSQNISEGYVKTGNRFLTHVTFMF